ncbi:type II toxin-antitoxin system VapC family toxin [Candidatus Bathyarchaeota archaeon]|nr:type II toxin-antitoxin system VapC family toxin [Candidatus Bathyarchaeota archaeon]
MKYLLDASALVNIVKRGEISKLHDAATIDLALYEALNAVWKEHFQLKKIDRKTAIEFVALLQRIFSVIDKISIEGLEKEIFEIACEHELTIYDASYVVNAIKRGCILLTDDRKLAGKTREIVEVKSSREI